MPLAALQSTYVDFAVIHSKQSTIIHTLYDMCGNTIYYASVDPRQ